MPTVPVTYYDETGPANTDETLSLAKRRAEELGIDTILVASTKGATGVRAAETLQGKRVIVVSHATGFEAPNTQQLTDENMARILDLGATVHTSTHALGGIGRAIQLKFNTVQPDTIVAQSLRMLSEGVKVACEMAAMTADAGLVRTGREVIAIAGTGEGCDTAIVIQPANVQSFFDLKIKEIICKPRL